MTHTLALRALPCCTLTYRPLALSIALIGLQFAALSTAHARIDNPKEPFISYTVQRGDNLSKLSKKLLAQPAEFSKLAQLNGLKNPALIQPGFVMDVPRSLLNLDSQPTELLTGQLLHASGDVLINNQAASAGAIIRQGDRVQTSAGASATVKMADGSRVQLMPRTLAEVTQQSQYAMKDPSSSISTTWFSGAIRLVEGLLDITAEKTTRRAKPFGVITNTSTLGVRGTQFRVAFEDPASGVARTEVLEGLVRTDNPAQSVGAELGGGFGTAFKPQDREIKVVALLPALDTALLPERVLRPRLIAGATQATTLWRVGSLPGAAGYRAEVARDEAFTQLVLQARSIEPSFDLRSLTNGIYFARVRGFDAQTIEGYNALRRIEIADAPLPPPPPAPVQPTVWVHEIGVAASAVVRGAEFVLQLDRRSADTPTQLTIELAQDAPMRQGLQSFAIDAQGRVAIPNFSSNETRYVRISGLSRMGQLQRSGVYVLRLPADWGQTVQTMSDALMPSGIAAQP